MNIQTVDRDEIQYHTYINIVQDTVTQEIYVLARTDNAILFRDAMTKKTGHRHICYDRNIIDHNMNKKELEDLVK